MSTDSSDGSVLDALCEVMGPDGAVFVDAEGRVRCDPFHCDVGSPDTWPMQPCDIGLVGCA